MQMANLDEDDYQIRLPAQNYAVVSVVGADLPQKTPNGEYGLKIRGVFQTLQEAEKHCKLIQQCDPRFDVWTMEMWKWLPFPPRVSDVDPLSTTMRYQEEKLDDLMQSYFEQQRVKKQIFEERVENVKRDGLDAHLLPEERLPPPPTQDDADTPKTEN